MIRIACNKVPEHIAEMRTILASFAEVDYTEWDYEQALAGIDAYDAYVTAIGFPCDAAVMARGERLKVIATPSTGRDHIDLQEAAARKIDVLSLKDDMELLERITSTAEQALLLMLAVLRHIRPAVQSVFEGHWESAPFRGHMVSGKTLGIIGYGRLGTMMAHYGRGLWMNVVAYDPYKQIANSDVQQVSYEELLAKADVISLHVHLNDETRGLLGREELAKAKPGVVIVNTSRGAIIDEDALLDGLRSGHIGGAGLDVLRDELYRSPQESPLVQYAAEHSHVVITPHIGGVTYEAQELAYARLAAMLKAYFCAKA